VDRCIDRTEFDHLGAEWRDEAAIRRAAAGALLRIDAAEKRKSIRATSSPGMTLFAPVPALRLDTWNEVGDMALYSANGARSPAVWHALDELPVAHGVREVS
jgi:hypothetical protein